MGFPAAGQWHEQKFKSTCAAAEFCELGALLAVYAQLDAAATDDAADVLKKRHLTDPDIWVGSPRR